MDYAINTLRVKDLISEIKATHPKKRVLLFFLPVLKMIADDLRKKVHFII